MALDQNIGMVTAYAYARSKGYTGTEDEFAEALANAGVTLDQIADAVDEFIETTVPAKVAEVTAEGTRQIGLVSAEGTEQIGLVEAEGTAQISAVNSAGSAQITAVEDKGAETLASIPADYSSLSTQLTNVSNDVSDLNSDLSQVESIFDTGYYDITPITSNNGLYINSSGNTVESASCSYKAVEINSRLINKQFKISGSAFYNIYPYVFVSDLGNITFPQDTYSSRATQYTDLLFLPEETGTLYVNIYTGHVGKVEYEDILTDSIKSDVLPIDSIANQMTDSSDYSLVNLGDLLLRKILNGSTGEITNGTNDIQRVTDYISVTPNTDYLITTESNYSRGLYAWYDANKNFISGASAASGSTYTHLYGERVKSPKDASYIVIGYIYQNPYPFPFLLKGNAVSVYESKKWTGRKWAIIGDSLSASYTPTGMHYFEIISGVTGISWTNLSVSGTGYAKGDSANFRLQALNVSADSDVVTFFGSGNDASSGLSLGNASDTGTATIAGCINSAIDNLYTISPLIPLGIITPTPWANEMPYDEGWMENYANLIVEICKRRSIPCLDLYHCSNLDTNNADVVSGAYSRDGGSATHLDETGHMIIAPRIKAFLETLLL